MNKTRIALVAPKATKTGTTSIPYGLASIAGHILENCENIEVKIIDGSLKNTVYSDLDKFKPQIVGVTATTPQIYDAHRILDYSKKMFNALTVIGGIHVSTMSNESLPHADIVVVNDGEIVFKEIIDKYQKGISQKGIFQGVEMEDINIPIPFHLLDIRGYLKHKSLDLVLKNPMIMVTSRGCPFKCLICYNSTRKTSVRCQSAEKIVADILFIHQKYGVTNFHFEDDNFLLNVKRFKKLAKLFRKHKIDKWIRWGCQTRAYNLSFEVLKIAKKVGIQELSLGIERGDQRLLAILKDNNTTIADHEKVFYWCKKLDIKVGGGLIFGYFDETREDMEASFKWVTKQTNLSFVAVGCIILYPTAKISEIYKKKGYLPSKINYEKMLQTNRAFDTYFFLENMERKEFATRLLHYSRLLRLYAEVNRTYSFIHFFFKMPSNKRWWWGWLNHPIHMFKLVYRILEIKRERKDILER